MSNKEQKTKLCLLRDIFRFIREYETEFQQRHGLCLNEGMALCSLKKGQKTSSELANDLGLSNSNMSKVIKSIEEKSLIERMLGEEDKRQMYFKLSKSGLDKLQAMHTEECRMTEVLDAIYETQNMGTLEVL